MNAGGRGAIRMTQIDAIFENGVLRPLAPLPLEEGQRVRVFVTAIFSQKTTDHWSKSKLEETGRKVGLIPDKATADAEEPASA